jgi:N-acetylated-alpha-linked acidic dipeptidase
VSVRHAWLAIFVAACAALAQAPVAAPIRGFPPEEWKAQHDREEQSLAIPEPGRIRLYMERIADKPHVAGSLASKAVADYAAAQLKEWGLDTRTETFEALLPYPTRRFLEMTSPVRYRAILREPVISADADTPDPSQIPTFNAYSASGEVSGPLVYVNYGLPEDYEYLRSKGIDVKGKIAIVRYGRSFRGVKPKLAQENGAIACLIYSDPRDDGYYAGDIYPKGPMRPARGVQRGSIIDMALYPGDPLSPGWASEPGTKRLKQEEATSLPKIPVMPISYADARPLLEQLAGPVVPESWRGALPITYHAGPGPAEAHLKVDFDWSTRKLYNVIATIPGSVYPDQWIVYGNHHDAWVNGASDPASGAAALMETARTLSVLRKQGWQPKRTIVLALWDGEEFGLIGSTEWAEKHLEELDRKAAVYINSDSNGRGTLGASGSHTLEAFLKEVLRDVRDPKDPKTLLESASVRPPGARSDSAPEFRLSPLGAGSDYVAFIDHAGVASLNLGFGGQEQAGVYHSIYDTLAWYDRFSDTDRAYGAALAQVMTVSILRLAGAAVLPFEFDSLSSTVRRYVDEIRAEMRKSPQPRPRVELREIQAQLDRLSAASKIYEAELEALWKRGSLTPEQLAPVNEAVKRAERALLLEDGLPGRPWYRHQIYAPGLYTGYNAKTLPGVREAVEGKRWEEANQQSRRVVQALRNFTARLEEASRLLKAAAN